MLDLNSVQYAQTLGTLQNYSTSPYVAPNFNTVLQFSCSCSPGEIDQTSPCEFLLWCVSHSLVAVAPELFPWHVGEENIRLDEVGDWSVRMVIVVLSRPWFLLDTFGFISSFILQIARYYSGLTVGFQVWLFLARCSHTPPPQPCCHRGTLLHMAWKWKNLIRRGDDMVNIWWLWWYGFFCYSFTTSPISPQITMWLWCEVFIRFFFPKLWKHTLSSYGYSYL